ncbi:YjcZ family sporulation protein [Rummeliibacillus pycnus]
MSDYQGGYGEERHENKFTLVVVLFILLIIVGTSFMRCGY